VILVDSSVWIDYFRGVATPHTDGLDTLLGVDLIGIQDVVLTEVLQGFDREHDLEAGLRALNSLAIIDVGGRDTAIQAARNFRFLRARGVTIRKTIDTLIATRCIEGDFALLYGDRDFDPFVEHLGLISALSVA
jgi:predicted nucleic acid-binding protein